MSLRPDVLQAYGDLTDRMNADCAISPANRVIGTTFWLATERASPFLADTPYARRPNFCERHGRPRPAGCDADDGGSVERFGMDCVISHLAAQVAL